MGRNFQQGDWVTWYDPVGKQWAEGKCIDITDEFVVVMLPNIKFPVHFEHQQVEDLQMQRRYFCDRA